MYPIAGLIDVRPSLSVSLLNNRAITGSTTEFALLRERFKGRPKQPALSLLSFLLAVPFWLSPCLFCSFVSCVRALRLDVPAAYRCLYFHLIFFYVLFRPQNMQAVGGLLWSARPLYHLRPVFFLKFMGGAIWMPAKRTQGVCVCVSVFFLL